MNLKSIRITQAKPSQIDWINKKYDEVNFVTSDYKNEHLVIAEVENEHAGLGRLVKIDGNNIELGGIYVFPEYRGLGVAARIVQNLCDHNPFKESVNIWCLPFEKLLSFYSGFGFNPAKNVEVPEKISQKLKLCNSGIYESNVLLLCKRNTKPA